MLSSISKIITIITLLSSTQVFSTTLCLTSENNKIKLEFNLPSDAEKIGSIKYENGKEKIKILLSSEKTISKKNTIPATVISSFDEIINNQNTGTYQLTSTAGIFGELTYKNKKTNKIYHFFDDQESYENDHCNWAK